MGSMEAGLYVHATAPGFKVDAANPVNPGGSEGLAGRFLRKRFSLTLNGLFPKNRPHGPRRIHS